MRTDQTDVRVTIHKTGKIVVGFIAQMTGLRIECKTPINLEISVANRTACMAARLTNS